MCQAMHNLVSVIAELPHSVLSLLVKYLSTRGLLRLDDLFCSKGLKSCLGNLNFFLCFKVDTDIINEFAVTIAINS